MSTRTDHLILEIAATHHHTTTRRDLLEAGIDPQAIDRRIGALLRPIGRGIYLVGPPRPRALLAAGLTDLPSAVAGHFTAAALLGLPVAEGKAVTLVAPHGVQRRYPPPLELRRTRHLPPDDVTEVEHFRSTTVERTICDIGWRIGEDRSRSLIQWAITGKRMKTVSFRACLRGFCRRGRRGSRLLRSLDLVLFDDRPMPDSELERRGRDLLDRDGPAGYVLHHRPPWSDGVRGIVDFAWPDARVIVELDGRRWHSTTEAQREDRARDRRAAAHGWVTLRFGWEEVVHRPRLVVTEIRRFVP